MSVQVNTPTKTQFEHQFSSPEKMTTKDDLNLRVDSKFSQPWQQRKRRYSQTYRREEVTIRRKRIRSLAVEKPVLPSKFLLGGNIEDPLNLNGLYTSEAGRILNDKTPQSSPLRTPTHRKTVEVRFPTDISDPLNLNSGDNERDLPKLCKKKKRHSRHKKKDGMFISPQNNHNSEMRKDLMEALKIDIDPHPNTPTQTDTHRQRKVSDKIVSPVIRQTSPKKRRRTNSGSKPDASSSISRALLISPAKTSPVDANKKFTSPKSFNRQASQIQKSSQNRSSSTSSSVPAKNKKSPKFVYGNYNKYYGYRNPSFDHDYRLDCFKSEWFEGKSVLDIGCNVGHLTLSIARDFHPKKIIGIDIDQKLIAAARKNIRYYLSSNVTDTSRFPISHARTYGPIEAPPLAAKDQRFPHNVLFMQVRHFLNNYFQWHCKATCK